MSDKKGFEDELRNVQKKEIIQSYCDELSVGPTSQVCSGSFSPGSRGS